MADSSPEVPGKNWHKEVGGVSREKQPARVKFYEQFAKSRLGIRENLDPLLPGGSHGLKTLEELRKAEEEAKQKNIDAFSRHINREGGKFEKGKGWTLYECLNNYFANNIGISDKKTREREVALSLHYLTRQKSAAGQLINVDLLQAKWRVEIGNGRLNVYDQRGKAVIDGAYLREPAPDSTEKVEKFGAPETVEAPKKRPQPKPKAKGKFTLEPGYVDPGTGKKE